MKSILRSGPVQSTLAFLIWAYMALIGRTNRWTVEGLDKVTPLWDGEEGIIAASWHSRILLLPVGWTRYMRHRAGSKGKLAIMISLSRDGEFVARAAEKLGLKVIRGSSGNKKKQNKNKGGAAAIRETGDLLGQGGAVCITVDGPRGPRQRASLGVALLAQRKNAKIVTYALASSPAHRFNSWDHFVLPFPFTKGAIVIGDIIDAPRDVPAEEIRLKVELALNAATQRAEELVGGTYEPPEPLAEETAS
ncbi:lysophospholipid acyltransferase family protein [Ponticaulis sp.]|uniref:lysophospholipid acyltransferase family protein n=1 Tax=Ponticaulis sp. TaxID=2020902 RepID=UPI000B7107C2|nr:lysophospholipid acyltransferase family protein [Ponticaulis sp.]OUY01598.1 MAG: hypothetical protein CBB65_00315 [Hyphomonadaceae bacterium TMED5]|tara:strand:- start:29601 stop:30347 length:747 start_codon:yes stop_codon:yes gene_type:complete